MSSVNVKINDDDITMNGDQMIFNPYNPNNHEITLNYVQSILKEYGLPPNVNNLELFRDLLLLKDPKKPTEYRNVDIITYDNALLCAKKGSEDCLVDLLDNNDNHFIAHSHFNSIYNFNYIYSAIMYCFSKQYCKN